MKGDFGGLFLVKKKKSYEVGNIIIKVLIFLYIYIS